MTRKHFEALAAAMRFIKPSNPVCSPKDVKVFLAGQEKEWAYATEAVADVCAGFNAPHFDWDVYFHGNSLAVAPAVVDDDDADFLDDLIGGPVEDEGLEDDDIDELLEDKE